MRELSQVAQSLHSVEKKSGWVAQTEESKEVRVTRIKARVWIVTVENRCEN